MYGKYNIVYSITIINTDHKFIYSLIVSVQQCHISYLYIALIIGDMKPSIDTCTKGIVAMCDLIGSDKH